MKPRKPTRGELSLLRALVERSPAVHLPEDWTECILVVDLDDGGMGSLRLIPSGEESQEGRRFGEEAAELRIADADGVPVIVTLYLDNRGQLFEIDVWRVDFRRVIDLPFS